MHNRIRLHGQCFGQRLFLKALGCCNFKLTAARGQRLDLQLQDRLDMIWPREIIGLRLLCPRTVGMLDAADDPKPDPGAVAGSHELNRFECSCRLGRFMSEVILRMVRPYRGLHSPKVP